jgi:hypothetical protein
MQFEASVTNFVQLVYVFDVVTDLVLDDAGALDKPGYP